MQFVVDRCGAVGLIVFLIANPRNGDQPAFEEALNFTLHGARTSAGEADQFGRKKTALRLAEQQTEHALLGH